MVCIWITGTSSHSSDIECAQCKEADRVSWLRSSNYALSAHVFWDNEYSPSNSPTMIWDYIFNLKSFDMSDKYCLSKIKSSRPVMCLTWLVQLTSGKLAHITYWLQTWPYWQTCLTLSHPEHSLHHLHASTQPLHWPVTGLAWSTITCTNLTHPECSSPHVLLYVTSLWNSRSSLGSFASHPLFPLFVPACKQLE